MPKKQSSQVQRQKRYNLRRQNEGLTKVAVWVPAGDREKAINYCKKLRNAYRKRMNNIE